MSKMMNSDFHYRQLFVKGKNIFDPDGPNPLYPPPNSPLNVVNALFFAWAGLEVYADLDRVGSFTDLSPNVKHAVNAVSGSQPLFLKDIGGIPNANALRFTNARGDFVLTPDIVNPATGDGITFFLVGKMDSSSGGEGNIFGFTGGGDPFPASPGSHSRLYNSNGGAEISWLYDLNGINGFAMTAAGTPGINTWFALTISIYGLWSAGSVLGLVNVNGVDLGPVAMHGALNGMKKFSIGRATSQSGNNTIAAVAAYPGRISKTNIHVFQNIFSPYYGYSVAATPASNPAVGADPFDVTSLSDLAFWHDTSKEIGRYVNTERVPRLTDQSGNGRHLDSISILREPVFETSVVNGRPAIKTKFTFGEFLRMAPTINPITNGFTLFAVMRSWEFVANGRRLLTWGNTATPIDGNWSGFYWSTVPAPHETRYHNPEFDLFSGNDLWHILEVTYAVGANTMSVWKNGTPIVTNAAINAIINNMVGISIGASYDGTEASSTYYTEDIGYFGVKSAGDRASIRASLGTKYNIAVV